MTGTGESSSAAGSPTDRPQRLGRIVVGVDGSEGSLSALRWAFDEAGLRKVAVHVVFAWQFNAGWGDPGLGGMLWKSSNPGGGTLPSRLPSRLPWGTADLPPASEAGTPDPTAAVNRMLNVAIEQVTERDTDNPIQPVTITQETVEGHAAKVLLDAVTENDLMVVGSHGHGGFVGALLGSVSHHVVAHSCCPVVVVPGPRQQKENPPA